MHPPWRRIACNSDAPSSPRLVLSLLIPKDPAPRCVSSLQFSSINVTLPLLGSLISNVQLFSCPVSSRYLQEPWVHGWHPTYMSVPNPQNSKTRACLTNFPNWGAANFPKGQIINICSLVDHMGCCNTSLAIAESSRRWSVSELAWPCAHKTSCHKISILWTF